MKLAELAVAVGSMVLDLSVREADRADAIDISLGCQPVDIPEFRECEDVGTETPSRNLIAARLSHDCPVGGHAGPGSRF
ncbi:MAG: hypothetical protein AAF495_27110 [Pseudomonadota bacterium]